MKNKHRAIWLVCLLLAVAVFAAGCGETQTPYMQNDADNYSVSVKYDANGGTFTTNTTVIVDSYNLSEMKTNSEGNAQIALIAPEDSSRGKSAFTAIYNGYFLAGWYKECTQSGTDADGNPTYTYSGKWDFATDRLEVAAGESHTSEEPVLTLYAAWVPLFEVEFYDLTSGEYLSSYTFNPTTAGDIRVPAWDETTGAVEMYDFPARTGYTYEAAYYDEKGTQPVDTALLTHPGQVNTATGVASDTVLRLYVDWTEGEWYRIYNVQQFLDNASVSGNYEIYADLDFTGEIWPSSLMYGSFTGSIHGNGHSFQNITLEQTNNSKTNAGLFGTLAETAEISDLTLSGVTVTIKAGTRMAGTCYGLLAGLIADGAAFENVTIADSCLQIDSSAYFGTEDYSIGLICGMGSTQLDSSGIQCKAVGDSPDSLVITVTDDMVTLSPAA